MPLKLSTKNWIWKDKSQLCYFCKRRIKMKVMVPKRAGKTKRRMIIFCCHEDFSEYLEGFADFHLQKYLAEHPVPKNQNAEISENSDENPNILCQNCPKYKNTIQNYVPEQTRRIIYEAGL